MLFKPEFGAISQVDATLLFKPEFGAISQVDVTLLFKFEFGAISQVDVTRNNTSVSPLAPLGRGLG